MKEEELGRAHTHMIDMLSAVEALREANTSLEVTNSALVEQVDKVHDRASIAEQESLRLWRVQLKKEEIQLGLSDDAVKGKCTFNLRSLRTNDVDVIWIDSDTIQCF